MRARRVLAVEPGGQIMDHFDSRQPAKAHRRASALGNRSAIGAFEPCDLAFERVGYCSIVTNRPGCRYRRAPARIWPLARIIIEEILDDRRPAGKFEHA